MKIVRLVRWFLFFLLCGMPQTALSSALNNLVNQIAQASQFSVAQLPGVAQLQVPEVILDLLDSANFFHELIHF